MSGINIDVSSPSLLNLWRENENLIQAKSFRQILQFSGEGTLRDGNATSLELRDLLSAVPLSRLQVFAQECISESFTDNGLALQDICNELGTRLGFKVEFGVYRGKKNIVGFDGLWETKDGYSLLVEAKTTDAYRINLDTLANYRESLIGSDRMSNFSSILVVVARDDTGDLEAQIRGSRHAWDVRLISVDSLFRLAAVKEQMSDWITSTRINQVLRPMEYTRVDGIIELLFESVRDIDEADDDSPAPTTSAGATPDTTPRAALEATRNAALDRVAHKLNAVLVKKGRALRSASKGSTNFVCLVSKSYPGPGGSRNYWYGLTPAHREFLCEADAGWLLLACEGSQRVLLVDANQLQQWLDDLPTSPPAPSGADPIRHWHIQFNDFGSRIELLTKGSVTSDNRDLIQHSI